MALSSNENQFQLSLDETTQGVAEPSLPGTPRAEKPELFLLDGMALVYRAFFALQRADMKTRDGVPTGAAFGFLTTLLKIYETYAPDYLAVAFDSREKHSGTNAMTHTRQTVLNRLKILSPSWISFSALSKHSTSRSSNSPVTKLMILSALQHASSNRSAGSISSVPTRI